MPLWRNEVLATAAWGGHSFTADGESDYKTISSLYNISSPKGSKTTFSIIIISGAS